MAHYNDKVLQTIKQNFYMDDCLKSVFSEQEALQMVQDLTSACAKRLSALKVDEQ